MRYFGRIIYLACGSALHDPLPRHLAVIQRTLPCIPSLVYWSLVVQYRTHTTKTLHYLADYLEEFESTKDVFATYQTSKTTDSIAHACMKDLNLQCKSEHTNQDEDWAERREAVSQAKTEHRKAEDKK
jgi:hypothetical protein